MSASPLGPDWHPAGNATDFEDEDVEQVLVGQLAVAVYKANGQFYATQDVCTSKRPWWNGHSTMQSTTTPSDR